MIDSITSLNPDSPIELFEISGWNLVTLSQTLYICNFTNVIFNGITYQAIGCESEGFDLIGQGPIPTPQLTVSNIGRVISDLLYNCKTNANYRLEGSTVLRRVTQKQFLDGQQNANAAIKELPQQQYIIEQMVEETYLAVKFRLGSPFDVEGVTLPARPLLRSCSWRYRSTECGWTGGMFTLNNQATANPVLDQCAKSLPACECRFGQYTDLPFGGAPGLNTYR
ncbi:phage minor tail protein L [Aetokthonos hydrillicola Thurmond2011]|jgi:lambda family phage minor tail protein L|uniref:Phage minor tail protein L n=1 Tax=Aetokthonos hydrillicola Thurmond2011 TaxID=2712845 RepID=A0AAP5IFL7_9CYAN|nr:phage minor tail protein L [Aetokthonos hydrillicola]MBO3459945.1 phage minor tail protein L [Aetokthonos hydrillicola CCALA 1050]MBW4584064.1 phage minor tail protein L [Aetokthonos hydrillicola CCALA 1050]MDR9900706.1 phage minor tail protein L [Aetokthonos hydrillicola Thurmond2011]